MEVDMFVDECVVNQIDIYLRTRAARASNTRKMEGVGDLEALLA